MPDPAPPSAEVTEAINRLSLAMEQLQGSYARSQRANRRLRLAMVIVLVLLAGDADMASIWQLLNEMATGQDT